MHVAYLTEWDPLQIIKWSGIPFHTFRAYKSVFDEIDVFQVPEFSKQTGSVDERLRTNSKLATELLRDSRADLLIVQGLSTLPYLETELPTLLWHDSLWLGLMRKPFDQFQREDPEYFEWDRRLLANVDRLLMSSEWANNLACDFYGYKREQVQMVSYGVNFDADWTPTIVERAVSGRDDRMCQLLFLGRRWKRKGLIHAVRLCERLNELGCPAKLTAVGCEPDHPEILASPHVEITGFLDKAQPDELRRLKEILWCSHFLIHPARFECSGIGLAEANAFGIPVLASDVGGLRSTVTPGSNGELFSRGEFVDRSTHFIMEVIARYAETYLPLARSAFAYQQAHFDWQKSAEIVRIEAEKLLAQRRQQNLGT